MRIIVNKCYGGFSLSDAAIEEYLRRKGIEFDVITSGRGFKSYCKKGTYKPGEGTDDENPCFHATAEWIENGRSAPRNDPILCDVVRDLGAAANGHCADLAIVEIPDDVNWEIAEYDGYEHVAEKHRTW